jgi:hypothetical protein
LSPHARSTSKWQDNEKIELPHPEHTHQMHNYTIYNYAGVDGLRFALSELSNGVYGVYVPQ